MLNGLKIVVVLPAYNAEPTLRRTVAEIPRDVADEVLLVDDGSCDATAEVALAMGLPTFVHPRNYGYGRNQKTCCRQALDRGADIIVMLHPDYQYTPKLITAMVAMIASGEFDVVLGSPILGVGALAGGMPRYKYVANRVLTLVQNLVLHYKLSEYHTGYRAFSRDVLLSLPLEENADDFVFDNEMLTQAICFGYRIGEISCPTRYAAESSSIPLGRAIRYGFGVLATSLCFRLARWGIARAPIFSTDGRKLSHDGRAPEPFTAVATSHAR
ncbi:MAG TPA: glycosyltransferase family 2 protein [Pirellulales bacterium]|jgi:glycosyltransferase involved in cell wall biosynthesis|nr:glycosyltransferase family 2 protein [Pirellulales bacterium]